MLTAFYCKIFCRNLHLNKQKISFKIFARFSIKIIFCIIFARFYTKKRNFSRNLLKILVGIFFNKFRGSFYVGSSLQFLCFQKNVNVAFHILLDNNNLFKKKNMWNTKLRKKLCVRNDINGNQIKNSKSVKFYKGSCKEWEYLWKIVVIKIKYHEWAFF